MKTIGMVGGTGWISSLEYYRLLNQLVAEELGGLNAAKCILYSVNYAEIDELNQQNKPEMVGQMIIDAAIAVKSSGADCLILCANTLHQFADEVKRAVELPLIHIGEATANVVRAKGIRKVGLLGTRYTMEMDFYHEKLTEQGIESIVPNKTDREFIHTCIMNEMLRNDFKPDSKKRLLKIIDQLKKEGAEGIILGCTEIPLFIKQLDCRVPLFNTIEIHTRAIVDFALH